MYGIIVIPLVFLFGTWLGSVLTAKLIYRDFKKNYFVEEKVKVIRRHPSSGSKPYFYDQDVEDEFDDIIKRLQ
jgi:uncharacterized protein YneF (UPF0154 family)